MGFWFSNPVFLYAYKLVEQLLNCSEKISVFRRKLLPLKPKNIRDETELFTVFMLVGLSFNFNEKSYPVLFFYIHFKCLFILSAHSFNNFVLILVTYISEQAKLQLVQIFAPFSHPV